MPCLLSSIHSPPYANFKKMIPTVNAMIASRQLSVEAKGHQVKQFFTAGGVIAFTTENSGNKNVLRSEAIQAVNAAITSSK